MSEKQAEPECQNMKAKERVMGGRGRGHALPRSQVLWRQERKK